MELVKAKCTNCGAPLEVDSTLKAAICPYCSQAYVVQDSINYYNIFLEHLHADMVTINDDRSAAARIKAGNAFLRIQEWDKADAAFQEACTLSPDDYLAWWGRIRALTHEFVAFEPEIDLNSIHLCEKMVEELKRLYKAADTFIPKDQKETYRKTSNNYIDQIGSKLSTTKKVNALCLSKLTDRIEAEEAKRQKIGDHLSYWDKITDRSQTDRLDRPDFLGSLNTFLWIGAIAFGCVIWLLSDWDMKLIPGVGLGVIVVITVAVLIERIVFGQAEKKAPALRQQHSDSVETIERLSAAKELLELEKLSGQYRYPRDEIMQIVKDTEHQVRNEL